MLRSSLGDSEMNLCIMLLGLYYMGKLHLLASNHNDCLRTNFYLLPFISLLGPLRPPIWLRIKLQELHCVRPNQ